MRRIVMVAVGLSLGFMTLSERADARPRGLPGFFGAITKPLGTILRAPASIGRRATHRRSTASRTRQRSPAPAAVEARSGSSTGAAAIAAPAAVAGAAVGATTVAAAPAPAASATAAPAPIGPTELGVVGPPRWPTAFEDVLGFALWPDKYGERLRAHGIGDIMSALFVPAEAGATGSTGRATARAASDGEARPDADGPVAACAANKPASADWPSRPIEQAMALNEVQRAALDQFRAATADAVEAIRAAACREDRPRTSSERLHAMQRSLWAVRDAAMLVRAPLISFYRSLSDDQKKHFTVPVSQPDPRLAQLNQRATQGRGGTPQIPREVARMCGMSAANEWPLRQIEQAIRPNPQQKASLEALQKRSTEMGRLLIASCIQPVAATPEARVDAALDRLTAMLFAITNITLALNDFHGQVDDEQKAKLAAFGL